MNALLMRRIALCLVAVILAAGCAKPPPPPPSPAPPPVPGLRTQKPYQINGIWYYPLPTAQGYLEEGIASWYGPDFHGKPTSCGEPYDMNAMTCAHKTLPMGTYVKVTHLQTGRTVILRVNDRGPFVAGRIIDLSAAAARELGTFQKGVAMVRVEAVQHASVQHIGSNTYWKVDPVPSFRYGQFAIQIGAFREQANAYRLKDRMATGYRNAQVLPGTDGAGSIYRVQVGSYQDILLARKDLDTLRNGGFGDAFVVATEGK